MAKKVELSGYMTVENSYSGVSKGFPPFVRKFRIASNVLDGKHFIMLRYLKAHPTITEAMMTFNRLNAKYLLGETWFMEINYGVGKSYLASVSFKTVNWVKYKRVLFEKGLDESFRRKCLKDGYATLEMNPHLGLRFLFANCVDKDNMQLKKNFCKLVFNVNNISEV
jgi:hypothetical protein